MSSIWFELAVGNVLNDLESVQLSHAHGDQSRLAHDALRQFEPPPACAETLELRHFNFAQMRHYYFALTSKMSIMLIMSNTKNRLHEVLLAKRPRVQILHLCT
ncbi:MAG: hypothetical protein V4796_18420 [Burkholderia cenocepacia]